MASIMFVVDPMVQATDYLVWVTGGLAVATATLVLVTYFTYRSGQHAAAVERQAERLATLDALKTELLLNITLTADKDTGVENESLLQADVATNFVPFQREAFSLALRYLPTLPVALREILQQVSLCISRYNTIAMSRWPTEIRWIVRALHDARHPLQQAAKELEAYLIQERQKVKR